MPNRGVMNFYAEKDPHSSHEEHVAVTMVILLAFSAGLIVILTAYHSICKTLNAVSYVGRNRISPRQTSPHFQSDSSDLTLSMARSYRPQYTISSPSYLGGTLTRDHKEVFQVVFNKNENSVTIDDSQISTSLCQDEDRPRRTPAPGHAPTPPSTIERSRTLSEYGQRRKLTATLSNTSTGSLRSRAPEFTDISIGADLLRFQREHQNSLHQRVPALRRSDPISLSSAIRNSLAMLLTYCTCSLPLVIMSVPDAAWTTALGSSQRVQILMLCRILFSLNAPAYPLWYLCCSDTVRKCFSRLWEAFMGKYGSAGRQ
ncbi:hypothetical protein RRG08_016178 [Elysia crispata]|uniref:Uncharacterized protein n=1 Tax=Elysia crispata TaxID=231223 RepID=A0AAE0ZPE4_9GAST|nr:hypothetical protein RRG08_016178 [Elysia crispata]